MKTLEAKEVTIPDIPKDKILVDLPPPDPKRFLSVSEDDLPPPELIAETILKYFWRRKSGYEDIEIITPSGEKKIQTQFVKAKVPLLSEVSRLFGLTKHELILLAKKYPDTIGRAIDAAMDVSDENMIHNTLEGAYHPSAASLIAPNISRIVNKQQVKVEDQRKISPILDQIEQNKTPYGDS